MEQPDPETQAHAFYIIFLWALAHHRLGMREQATQHDHEALRLLENLNQPEDQALVHNNLGALHQGTGRWNEAASFTRALELYTALDLPLRGNASR